MRSLSVRIFLWTLLVFSLTILGCAQVASEDERAIRALTQEFDAAWNARDAGRFSACFTEDGEMWFRPFDEPMRGRDQIRKSYLQILSGLTPDTKHVTVIEATHAVAPGVLLLDGKADILASAPSGNETITARRYSGMAILLKTAQGWRILFFRAWSVPKIPD